MDGMRPKGHIHIEYPLCARHSDEWLLTNPAQSRERARDRKGEKERGRETHKCWICVSNM